MLKKADIPMHKRAGELCEEDVEKIITIMQVSLKLFRGKLISLLLLRIPVSTRFLIGSSIGRGTIRMARPIR